MVGTAKEQAEELLKRCRLWKQKKRGAACAAPLSLKRNTPHWWSFFIFHTRWVSQTLTEVFLSRCTQIKVSHFVLDVVIYVDNQQVNIVPVTDENHVIIISAGRILEATLIAPPSVPSCASASI